MRRRSTRGEPTPLSAIRPQVEGRAALMVHAARRWRYLAGPGTARRLPLLDVQEGAWIIGIPSEMWQAELDRLARQEDSQGRKSPRLIGRLMTQARPAARRKREPAEGAPPAGAGAPQRLRWLMEQLSRQGEDL